MAVRGADKQWTLFFDDVELEEERLIGGENGGLGVVFDGLNPGAHHGRVDLPPASVGWRSSGAPLTLASDGSGENRSALTRAWPTRWLRRRSSSSSRA